MGTRRRWLIFVAVLMIPFWTFFYLWNLRWDLLSYGALILFSWYFGGIAAAYYIGGYLRRRNPDSAEFL